MSTQMHWIQWARLIVFPMVVLLSVIILGLAADQITTTTKYYNTYYNFDAFAVAVSVFSFSLVPMFFIDRMRSGAITSWILVELSWGGFLWVLWLASAALSANDLQGVVTFCGNNYAKSFAPDWWSKTCSETQAIVAFSWLNWIALSAYLTALLVLSIVAHNKGNPIWRSSVREATFTPVNVDLSGTMGSPVSEHKAPVSPMQQPGLPQSYPPQQTGYPNV